jgi:hypothetical protein
VYLGAELGGRPRGDAYYDDDGRVLYERVAKSSFFLNGLAGLEQRLRQYSAALLCSEEDPSACHRRLLIGRVLAERGILVEHIRGDGTLQTEDQLLAADPANLQMALFADQEAQAWKSIPSVSLKRRHTSSSAS